VTGTLADVMTGRRSVNRSRPIIFSPFGMGVLDLAVGKWVYDQPSPAARSCAYPISSTRRWMTTLIEDRRSDETTSTVARANSLLDSRLRTGIVTDS